MLWQTAKRKISFDRPLVMGILNTTPDSFSDGGMFASVDAALQHAEEMIKDGVSVIDVGGESTRPGSERIPAEVEIERVVPVIEAIAKRFDIPISIDTSKATVAEAAVDAGAEIINDISGLRFDESLADVAAEFGTGLVLMHSRGEFETMHSQPPVDDVISEVAEGLDSSIATARNHSVSDEAIVLDVGIGFGKTADQNLELIAKLGKLVERFPQFPMLVGASRKSFIGRLLSGVQPEERLAGSLASAVIAVWNGASIVRVHDVRETVEALKIADALRKKG